MSKKKERDNPNPMPFLSSDRNRYLFNRDRCLFNKERGATEKNATWLPSKKKEAIKMPSPTERGTTARKQQQEKRTNDCPTADVVLTIKKETTQTLYTSSLDKA